MRQYIYYCGLVIYGLVTSTVAKSQVQKIYLNPKAAGNGKQSNFVDSIRFIPLEMRGDVQSGSFSFLSITDKNFLITDFPSKTMIIYTQDGHFLKKLSLKKLGQLFHTTYSESTNQVRFLLDNKNYLLTDQDRVKIKMDWNNTHNKKYFKKYTVDLDDTSFVMKQEVPNENDILNASPFYDDVYWQSDIGTSPLYKDSIDYEFKIYKAHQLTKSFFPYNRINEPKFLYTQEQVAISKTDTAYTYFITRPFCDTIYKMFRDSLTTAYQLILPLENSPPASFYNKPFKNKTERENFRRNNGWMLHQIYNFYETPKLIFFTVQYLSYFESYIYQKPSHIVYRVKNIRPDNSQYNVQLLTDFETQRKGNLFYKALQAGDLTAFFNKNQDVPIPRDLEIFLKSNPPKNAFVIIEFKLKN